MQEETHKSKFRHQASLIIVGSGFVVFLTIILGMMTLSRFAAVETAWSEHSKRATAIGDALSSLDRHIGYGGFIHHLKNAVLRLDFERYRAALQRDIDGLTADFKLLNTLLKESSDQKALAQVRSTFDTYIQKYQQLGTLIDVHMDPAKIDQLIKVSDAPALKALAFLSDRAGQRAAQTQAKANRAYDEAVFALRSTEFLVVLAVLIGMVVMVMFLRRVVIANELILQTQKRLDVLLDMSPDPMLSVSTNGEIVRANNIAQKFFGYTINELQNMKIEKLIPKRYRDNHPSQRDHYFKHASQRPMGDRRTLQALTKDGSEPDVEISLSHSGEGDDRLATITIRDITEREKNRKALDRARTGAEDALARQEQLQDGLVEAEKMAALGGLVAGIAHEINTPIGVTLTSATHFESETKKAEALYKAGEMTEEALSEYFDTATQVAHMMTLNTRRASDLIHSFKQVAVDQTGDECRLFDMADYIEEILLSLRPHIKKRPVEVQLNCEKNLSVYGHPGGLSQILTNLITNSLKYAFDEKQAGTITISVVPIGDNVQLVYKDDGKGMSPKIQETAFEPFVTTGRGKGGSGLGLYIVYNIVTQTLKGTIDLTSSLSKGVTYTIDFPKNIPDSNQGPSA